MEGNFKVTTLPTSEPVTLAEIKAHLNVDFSADDDLLLDYISAAREYFENNTSLAIMPQTITQVMPGFPELNLQNSQGEIRLYKFPVQSLTSISYYDESDAVQTVEISGSTPDVLLDSYASPCVVTRHPVNLESWPATKEGRYNAVTIVFAAGYANAAAVPRPIKHAIKLLVGEMYEKRENMISERITAVDHIMKQLQNKLY